MGDLQIKNRIEVVFAGESLGTVRLDISQLGLWYAYPGDSLYSQSRAHQSQSLAIVALVTMSRERIERRIDWLYREIKATEDEIGSLQSQLNQLATFTEEDAACLIASQLS